nr:hypothetical protein SHINE37_44589 [Rhizobiaceae bacterium]
MSAFLTQCGHNSGHAESDFSRVFHPSHIRETLEIGVAAFNAIIVKTAFFRCSFRVRPFPFAVGRMNIIAINQWFES